MATLGRIYELKAKNVGSPAIKQLLVRMSQLPKLFPFDCALCGAERFGDIIDPGLISVREFKCSEAEPPALCRRPALPKAKEREPELLPGCLVYAPYEQSRNPGDCWPAIIEDCPDGMEEYKVAAKTGDKIKAYFVTYIFADQTIENYKGAFIDARQLLTFTPPQKPNENATNSFNRAVALTCTMFLYPLHARLRHLSFTAAVAHMRGDELGPPPETMLMKLFAEKVAQDTETKPRRRRLPPGVTGTYVPSTNPNEPGPSRYPTRFETAYAGDDDSEDEEGVGPDGSRKKRRV